MAHPVAETIDITGVRALFDALGAEEAARWVRCMSVSDGETIPELRRGALPNAGGRLVRVGTHCEIGHHMDDDASWWIQGGIVRGPSDTGMPATVMASIVGRSVTDVLDHPCLDATMAIEEASHGTGTMMRLSNTRRDLRETEACLRNGVRP